MHHSLASMAVIGSLLFSTSMPWLFLVLVSTPLVAAQKRAETTPTRTNNDTTELATIVVVLLVCLLVIATCAKYGKQLFQAILNQMIDKKYIEEVRTWARINARKKSRSEGPAETPDEKTDGGKDYERRSSAYLATFGQGGDEEAQLDSGNRQLAAMDRELRNLEMSAKGVNAGAVDKPGFQDTAGARKASAAFALQDARLQVTARKASSVESGQIVGMSQMADTNRGTLRLAEADGMRRSSRVAPDSPSPLNSDDPLRRTSRAAVTTNLGATASSSSSAMRKSSSVKPDAGEALAPSIVLKGTSTLSSTLSSTSGSLGDSTRRGSSADTARKSSVADLSGTTRKSSVADVSMSSTAHRQSISSGAERGSYVGDSTERKTSLVDTARRPSAATNEPPKGRLKSGYK